MRSKIQDISEPQSQIRHSHPLIPTKNEDQWLCDICNKDFPETLPKNRCLICDYDECDSCYKKNSGGPFPVRHGHTLREEYVPNICTACRCRVEPDTTAFQCITCLAVQCTKCRSTRPDPEDNRDFKHELHEHKLNYCEPYGGTSYKCDICELTYSGMAFHCPDCNYDICRMCMGAISDVLPRHTHYWKMEIPSWRCTRCALTVKNSFTCYKCPQCNYRECKQCHPTATGPVVPHHPHPLSLSSDYPAGWICDLCQTTFPSSTSSHHCDQCGYDECNFCFKTSHGTR